MQDFEPYAAFRRIDRSGRGLVASSDIVEFLKENMVDYVNEIETFYMFRYFDKDNDGMLDFDDFLYVVMPNDDIAKRAEAGQRWPFKVDEEETMAKHVEFELSRLLEKEIHYHIKVEIEKKALERQADFNTVATFTLVDQMRYGYLDFDTLKKFMQKFKKDVQKPDINAVIRRLDWDGDNKVSF